MAQRPHDLVPRGAALSAPWLPTAEPIEVSPAVGLPSGCYRLVVRPYLGPATFHGTLRVEQRDVGTIASGDLYRYPRFPAGAPDAVAQRRRAAARADPAGDEPPRPPGPAARP